MDPVVVADDGGGAAKWWIGLLVGLLVAGAIVAGLLLTGKDKVLVPNMVNNPQAEAEIVLKRAGFSTDVTDHDSSKPKGTVIGQDPGGGSHVAKGSIINLIVSGGPGQSRVPDLTIQPQSAAVKQLKALGFTTTVEKQTSDTVVENHVISTRPDVGTQQDKGTNVVIVVSSGKQRETVPKVTGLDQDEARSTLEALGFVVTAGRAVETSDEDPGTVMTQVPAANARAAKGSTVTITVAKAPPEVAVPDVSGQGRLAAQQALEAAGFRVTLVPQTTDDKTQDLHVISQDPASGQKAKKGSTVTVTYGQYEAAAPSSTAPGSTTAPGTTTSTTEATQ